MSSEMFLCQPRVSSCSIFFYIFTWEVSMMFLHFEVLQLGNLKSFFQRLLA